MLNEMVCDVNSRNPQLFNQLNPTADAKNIGVQSGCCQSYPDSDLSDDQLETALKAFQSGRLTRKLKLFCRDIWFIMGNSHKSVSKMEQLHHCTLETNYNWISDMIINYGFLFAFETRLDFWRISSQGPSRWDPIRKWITVFFQNVSYIYVQLIKLCLSRWYYLLRFIFCNIVPIYLFIERLKLVDLKWSGFLKALSFAMLSICQGFSRVPLQTSSRKRQKLDLIWTKVINARKVITECEMIIAQLPEY